MSSRLESAINAAISSVDDPEYPGISIVDLGLLETVVLTDAGTVTVGLIPTFSGCPELAVIEGDVCAAVGGVDGVTSCSVEWLSSPTWHTNRISHEARACLERRHTVAVQLGERAPSCPLCTSKTTEQSDRGTSMCRSVHVCTGCGETLEVLRG